MIDVKELRVGNHVLADGERKWVKSTSYPWIFLDDDVPYHEDHLEPIPLTAELLTEIGFEQSKGFSRDWHKEIGIDLITVHFFLDRKTARIFVSGDSKDYGNLLCRYLHELEFFVYMTLHRELIED